MSDTPPRLLGGRYEVGELIGRGGMAEVHLGHDARLGRPVAIKILRSDHARDATFMHRFRREAQSVAGLNHRSVVAVYDSGEDQITEAGGAVLDIPYIVMEYVDGRTLREVLNEEGTLEPGEAARITGAVLDALAYSHQMGIVHRDIKPGNVMVADDGAVKVMDFGIARAVADAQATMTQTQAVIGTAQYISPEQARGETVDNRSDIYSTGCLLFELLTGRTPFVGDPISLTYQHVNAAPPLPSDLNPDVPAGLDAVVLHALTKDRDERYPDALDMEEDLDAFRRGLPVSPAAMSSLQRAGHTELLPAAAAGAAAAGAMGTEHPTAVTPAAQGSTGELPEEKRRRGVVGWIIAGVLLLALAGLAFFAWQQSQPDPVDQVRLENLVGMTQEEAEQTLEDAGLEPEIETEESEDAESGTVLAQNPGQGERVDVGSTVTLTVSTGIGQTQVPDLAGMSEDDAQGALEDAGLELGESTTENSPDVPEDEVISSSPGAGETVDQGTSVDIVVSTGQVELPDFRGQSISDVRQEVYALGLDIEEETTESDEEAGTILGQSPGAGTVDQGSTVTFEVATAPAVTSTETETETKTPTPTDSSSSLTSSDGEPSSTSTPEPTSTSATQPSSPETPPNASD